MMKKALKANKTIDFSSQEKRRLKRVCLWPGEKAVCLNQDYLFYRYHGHYFSRPFGGGDEYALALLDIQRLGPREVLDQVNPKVLEAGESGILIGSKAGREIYIFSVQSRKRLC